MTIATVGTHYRQTTISLTFPWAMWNSRTFPVLPCGCPPRATVQKHQQQRNKTPQTDQGVVVDVGPERLGNWPMTDCVTFLRRPRDEDELTTALPRCTIRNRSSLHWRSWSARDAVLFTAAFCVSKQHKYACPKYTSFLCRWTFSPH